MTRSRNIYLFIILGLVGLFYLCPVNAHAATSKRGLTLSPLRSELDIAPGTSLDGMLTVTNSTDKPMEVNLFAEEFSVINQQYDYAFTTESDVTKWVTFASNTVSLKVGESQKIKFTVGVPLSAEPGGRYISLFTNTNVSDSGNEKGSQQRIASLLYITVTGDVTRAGNLLSLNAPWLTGGDAVWSATLQNTGTTHFRSRYNVQIKNLWGGDIVDMKQGDDLILPGTVRLISDEIPLPQFPGIYKVIYTIGLGDTPAKVETRFILYLPPLVVWLGVAIIAICAIRSTMKKQKIFN